MEKKYYNTVDVFKATIANKLCLIYTLQRDNVVINFLIYNTESYAVWNRCSASLGILARLSVPLKAHLAWRLHISSKIEGQTLGSNFQAAYTKRMLCLPNHISSDPADISAEEYQLLPLKTEKFRLNRLRNALFPSVCQPMPSITDLNEPLLVSKTTVATFVYILCKLFCFFDAWCLLSYIFNLWSTVLSIYLSRPQ